MSGTRMQPYRVADLTRKISEGKLSLPEFQRDFDWTDEQVASLIATVIKRWPAGSLLLMEGRDELFFRQRAFEDAPELADKIELIVLDGQQRLTGLYQAIYDTGRFVYAIRADVLTPDASVDELEDAIKSVKRDEWDRDYRHVPWTKNGVGWIPFYALRSTTDYFLWRDQTVQRAQLLPEQKDRLSIKLADAYRQGLEAFHQHDLPSVIVERSVEPAAVARIFERVNTTGIPLTTFDLMVARTFKDGWNLRDRWDAALAEFELFPTFFGDNGLAALQLIALKHGAGVRQSDVLSLEAAKVRKHWDKTLVALDRAVNALYEHCGVLQAGWLPYPGLLLTLAGVSMSLGDLERHRKKVRRWFFSRVFGQRYEVAANTVTMDEVEILHDWLSGEAGLPSLRMDADVVATASRRRRGAIWKGFVCALAAEGAVDLHGEEVGELTPVSVIEKREPERKGEEAPHLLAMGFVLATRQEARKLGLRGAQAFSEFVDQLPSHEQDLLVERQLIPVGVLDDEEFLEARLELLSDFLNRTTGSSLAWEEE